jgi:KUP system potassium uptake protein
MFVTLFDTTMTGMTALIVWRVRPYYVFLPWLIFATMDGAFISSALEKVPHGAWFTLALATVLALVFLLWRFGKENQWKAEAEDRHPLSTFVHKDADGTLQLPESQGGEPLSAVKGLAIFFDKGGINTPQVFSQYINKFVCLPEVVIFFHMRPLEYPTVPAEERFVVSKLRHLPNCYRIVLRYGFMDEVLTPDLAALLYRHLRNYIIHEAPQMAVEKGLPAPMLAKVRGHSTGEELKGPVNAEASDEPLNVLSLDAAYNHRVIYLLGKEEMLVRSGTRIPRRVLLGVFLFLRDYSRNKMSNIKVPTERLVELGFIKQI